MVEHTAELATTSLSFVEYYWQTKCAQNIHILKVITIIIIMKQTKIPIIYFGSFLLPL